MIRSHVLEFLSEVYNAAISLRNLFFFFIFYSFFFKLSMILQVSFRPYAIRASKSHPFQVVHRVRMVVFNFSSEMSSAVVVLY